MAHQVNIQIKQIILGNTALKQKIEEMENKYDKQFLIVFDAIKKLLEPSQAKDRRIIGFDKLQKK